MCGLVGMIARKPYGFGQMDVDMMQNLLHLDQIRGDDSTGVFTITRDKNVTVTKIGSHPTHLFTTTLWAKHRAKAISSGKIMIGHNRAATRGAITSENAHPFHENNIVLVHNGTLRGDHTKLAQTEVDSHAVCHAFNEVGAEEVISTLDAAFAFIWWDIEKSKLFAIRNDERPLCLVTTEDYHFLVSESWMATALLHRAGKKIDTITQLSPGELYEFNLDGTFSTRKIPMRPVTTWDSSAYSAWGESYRMAPSGRYARNVVDDIDMAEDDIPFKKTPLAVAHTTTPPRPPASVPSTPFVLNEHFNKGDEVIVKILNSEVQPTSGQKKVTGEVWHPGKPTMDFVGYIPGSRDAKDLMQGYCVATALSFSRSTCGDSMWVRDIRPATMIKLHNTDIPEVSWKHLINTCYCTKCTADIKDADHEFTSVRPAGAGSLARYRPTCADCVEHTLTGAAKDVFVQRRTDALQNAVAVSNSTPSRTLSLVKKDDTPTLH